MSFTILQGYGDYWLGLSVIVLCFVHHKLIGTPVGFRKVDSDKWEFANEGFLRGNRHLLKNIHRRKSTQTQQLTSYGGSSSEAGLGSEIEKLRNEKSALMQEVIDLQQQQRGTVERVERVKDRLQASEQRQKQMVSFLAKVLQNPVFIDRLKQMKEQNKLVSARTKKKFLKQKQQEAGSSGGIGRYSQRPEFEEFGELAPEIPMSIASDNLLQDVVGNASSGVPFRSEDVAMNEIMDIPGSSGAGLLSSWVGKQLANPQLEAANDYLVSFPEELVRERASFPEFSSPGIENMIKQEDVWSIGFDLSTDVSSSSPALWGNIGVPDVGTSCPGELSDVLDLSSLQAGTGTGSSGVEHWLGDDSAPVHQKAFESKDDNPRENTDSQ
ncbi:Heat stress transcription factor A-3 [Bienertia sinuspersici]